MSAKREAASTCARCGGTGVIDSGNNELPCDCPAGGAALFEQAGVCGPLTGAEIRRHFLTDSPEPIRYGGEDIQASALPGRSETLQGAIETRGKP